ncbi:MAG: terminase small subunit [Desulfovibrionales bacterium]|nr:terminase small subunit [Desulfovibrionales bacterium]
MSPSQEDIVDDVNAATLHAKGKGKGKAKVEKDTMPSSARERGVANNIGAQSLTLRQQRFVREYLVDNDGEKAALRAGYSAPSARRTAQRLLGRRDVQSLLKGQTTGAEHVTQQQVVQELAAVGFANLSDVCTWDDGHLVLKPSSELSAGQAASIAEITETVTSRGGTVRVKLHSKLKALEMLAKHVGLYDSFEETTKGGVEELSPVLKKKLEQIYGVAPDSKAADKGAACSSQDSSGAPQQ